MTEFVINSEQLERLVEGIEHNTGRKINKVICDGAELPIIVRCRDCRHYTEDEFEYYQYCGEWCEQVKPDGFCAWGEGGGR